MPVALDEQELRDIIGGYKGQKGVLLDAVHEILDAQGYISPRAIQLLSDTLNMPVAEVYGVVTYYSEIPLEPPAALTIRLCMGPACHIRGMQRTRALMEKELGIGFGERTQDNRIAFEPQQCPGICHLAPVAWVNGSPKGPLQVSGVGRFLNSIGAK